MHAQFFSENRPEIAVSSFHHHGFIFFVFFVVENPIEFLAEVSLKFVHSSA